MKAAAEAAEAAMETAPTSLPPPDPPEAERHRVPVCAFCGSACEPQVRLMGSAAVCPRPCPQGSLILCGGCGGSLGPSDGRAGGGRSCRVCGERVAYDEPDLPSQMRRLLGPVGPTPLPPLVSPAPPVLVPPRRFTAEELEACRVLAALRRG